MEPAEQQVLFPIVGGGVVELAEVACFCLPVEATRGWSVVLNEPRDRVDQINRILTDARAGETDQKCAVRPVRVRFSPENFCGGSFSLALALADKRARLGPGVVKPARIIATGIIRAGCRGLVDPVECFEAKLSKIAKIANLEDIVVVPSANLAPGTPEDRHWQEMCARGVRCFAIRHLDEVSFLWGSVDHPYIGLRTFTKNESRIFFGREREKKKLVEKLQDPGRRFLAVVGASGTGKSSLVYAGLLPLLERDEITGSAAWRVESFTPRSYKGDPFLALAVDVLRPLLPQSDVEPPDDLAEVLANDPQRILQYVDQVLAGAPTSAQFVLVVDQMEDLFTQVAEKHRERFVELLAKAAEHSRVRILATLRTDFLTEAQRYPPLDIWLQSPFVLAPPGSTAVSEMIYSPARLAGIKIEDGLVDKILHDAGNNIGAMPLIAFIMNKLYRPDENEPPRTFISIENYDDIKGGMHGAIAAYAEEMLVKWQQKNKLSDYDKEIAITTIFEHLVDVDITGREFRRRANRNDFEYNERVINLLDYLISKSRLLVCTDYENCQIVELVHDALLEKWPRLAEWIKLNREKKMLWAELENDTRRWLKTRNRFLLWRGPRLREAKKLLNYSAIYKKNTNFQIIDIQRFVKASSTRVMMINIYKGFLGLLFFCLFFMIWWFSVANDKILPVGVFDPNPFGIYDVHGNVWEWTQECITGENSSANGSAQIGRKYEWCVVRGGSWDNYQEESVSLLFKLRLEKPHTGSTVGFRVLREFTQDELPPNIGDDLDVQPCLEGRESKRTFIQEEMICFKEKECEDCPKMVIIPEEQSIRTVLSSETEFLGEAGLGRFAIGQYEITVTEWEACVSENVCNNKLKYFHNFNKYDPVRFVSFSDAQQYTRWLSKKVCNVQDNEICNEQKYRLPRGEEWEYAARGGGKECRWWGEELGIGKANCDACGVTVERLINWFGLPVGPARDVVELVRRGVELVFSLFKRPSNEPINCPVEQWPDETAT